MRLRVLRRENMRSMVLLTLEPLNWHEFCSTKCFHLDCCHKLHPQGTAWVSSGQPDAAPQVNLRDDLRG